MTMLDSVVHYSIADCNLVPRLRPGNKAKHEFVYMKLGTSIYSKYYLILLTKHFHRVTLWRCFQGKATVVQWLLPGVWLPLNKHRGIIVAIDL